MTMVEAVLVVVTFVVVVLADVGVVSGVVVVLISVGGVVVMLALMKVIQNFNL